MSNFNDQLSRMKALMTYGTVNEDANHISSYNIEYKAKAADGKYYGIIRENSKYFVKVATPGKEMVAESYQYIGGVQNKKNYEYNSYANALKQFELKLGSINEAYDEDRKVNVEALDPYKKEDLVIEGTEKMKNELARQRQIMRNACVIMNEATEIGSTPFKSQPESEHDNSGDKDYPFTKEGKPEEDRGAIKFDGGDPEKHSSTFGDDSNDVEDYDLDGGKTPKVDGSVASENPKGGKVARVNESMEECGGMAECGTGLMPEEGEEDLDLGDKASDVPVDTEELDSVAPEELGGEEEIEPEMGDELGDKEGLGNDEDELGDDDDLDLGDEEDLDDEEGLDDDEFDFDEDDDEFGDEDELDDDEDLDLGDEEEFGEEGDEYDEVPEDGEFDDDEDFEGEEEDPEIELDENIVKKFRQLVRESINEMFNEWNGSDELEMMEKYPELMDDEGEYDEDDVEDAMNREIDRAEAFGDMYNENKAAKMNSIVESVVKDILNEKKSSFDLYSARDMKQWCGTKEFGEKTAKKAKEEEEEEAKQSDKKKNFNSRGSSKWAGKWADKENKINEDELHVFGDHPGYRKKPMTLPQTGEDKFQVNRDWNDDSVHSEEPFGKGKGDSTPFDQLVAQITDSVMKQINENKKKVK